MLSAYVVFVVVVVSVVVRDLCRSGCTQDLANFYLSPVPSLFVLCPKAGFGDKLHHHVLN